MLLSRAKLVSWMPWLVPGDAIIDLGSPHSKALVLSYDERHSRILVTQHPGNVIEWCAESTIRRLLVHPTFGVLRCDSIWTLTEEDEDAGARCA